MFDQLTEAWHQFEQDDALHVAVVTGAGEKAFCAGRDLVKSATQFGPNEPPPSLTSARYTRDFAEVKALGSAASTARTAAQTSTALFFSGNALVQYNAALRDQIQPGRR